MNTYRADTYGQRIADIYDDWYDVLDEATVPVLVELARASPGGRALELGIGTGRVAIPVGGRPRTRVFIRFAQVSGLRRTVVQRDCCPAGACATLQQP